MNFFFLLISTILSIEIILFFDLIDKFRNFFYLLKKNNKLIILKKTSDHWKQKFILIVAFRIIKLGVILSTLIIIIVIPIFIINFFHKEFIDFILSTIGIFGIIIISSIYILLRKKIVQK